MSCSEQSGYENVLESDYLTFHPTPALSLGEREPRMPALDESKSLGLAVQSICIPRWTNRTGERPGLADTLPTILPLPKGEGWGEAEGGERS